MSKDLIDNIIFFLFEKQIETNIWKQKKKRYREIVLATILEL